MSLAILGISRILFLALLYFLAAPAQAATMSYLLKIDSLASVSNIDGGFAGSNQNFSLSGTFQANVIDASTIQFVNIDVVATALDSIKNLYPPGTVLNFAEFPTFPGIFDGLNFSGNMAINSELQSYTGIFDGISLSMKGQVIPSSPCCDQITTVYSIRAVSAAVTPTPTATPLPAPLPAGTLLRITPTMDQAGFVPCANGSCFGMFLAPGLNYWTPIYPGTDGGIVIGKAQKSGGQELVPGPGTQTDGELSAAWYYGANYGTFFTAPDATGNIFASASCSGAACLGRTELKVFNAAWYGLILPLGSETGCDPALYDRCTPDQANGIFVKNWKVSGPIPAPPTTYTVTWSLEYSQVIKEMLGGLGFTNFPFQLLLRGTIGGGTPPPQPIVVVTPANLTGVYNVAIPFTISATDPDGAPLTCRVGTVPANGVTVLTGCTAGTYTANLGFIGTDTFFIIANNGLVDSVPATVTAAITAPTTDTRCTALYPVTQATVMGRRGHLSMIFTGNIMSLNPNGKEIKICPTTTAAYEASTNTPGATVVCKVKSNTGSGQGNVKVNDHIKCTDKPVGNDKINVKIKSGINQKVM